MSRIPPAPATAPPVYMKAGGLPPGTGSGRLPGGGGGTTVIPKPPVRPTPRPTVRPTPTQQPTRAPVQPRPSSRAPVQTPKPTTKPTSKPTAKPGVGTPLRPVPGTTKKPNQTPDPERKPDRVDRPGNTPKPTPRPTAGPTIKAPTNKPPTAKPPTRKPPTTPPTSKPTTTKPTTTKPPTTKPPTTKPPTTKPPTTKPPTTPPETTPPTQPEDELDEGDAEGTVPRTKTHTRKKIKFPENGKTNVFVPSDAGPIQMPNIEKKIADEVKRLTLSLSELTREFIEGGQTFESIDFVPTVDIVDSDDLLYFIESDPNVPLSTDSDNSQTLQLLNDLIELIQSLLDKGDPTKSMDYASYLELFEIDYVGVGRPVFKFGIDLEDDIIIGDIELELVDGGTE